MKAYDGFAYRSSFSLWFSLERTKEERKNENDMRYAAYRIETKEW